MTKNKIILNTKCQSDFFLLLLLKKLKRLLFERKIEFNYYQWKPGGTQVTLTWNSIFPWTPKIDTNAKNVIRFAIDKLKMYAKILIHAFSIINLNLNLNRLDFYGSDNQNEVQSREYQQVSFISNPYNLQTGYLMSSYCDLWIEKPDIPISNSH